MPNWSLGASWCWGELGSCIFGMWLETMCGSWPGSGEDCKPGTIGPVCRLGLQVAGPLIWFDAGANWEP